MFLALKKYLSGHRFTCDEDVKHGTITWLSQQRHIFFASGLLTCMTNAPAVTGTMLISSVPVIFSLCIVRVLYKKSGLRFMRTVNFLSYLWSWKSKTAKLRVSTHYIGFNVTVNLWKLTSLIIGGHQSSWWHSKILPRTAMEVHAKFYGNFDDQCVTKRINIADILFLALNPF
jgi:hypothetical protein